MTRWKITHRLEDISAADWNRLDGTENPFLRHEFLVALERNACVGEASGWLPRHVTAYEDGRLVGAVPMYLKHHSYGEFVFDWSWAEAYARNGLAYYPKLVVAVPFTPVPGPRLLVAPETDQNTLRRELIDAVLEVARESSTSSLHWLFPNQCDTDALDQSKLIRRCGVQYHWFNPGYRDFDDFLGSLTSKKRKQIKRERRQSRESGLRVEMRWGERLGEPEWDAFYGFYCSTYDRKWGFPSLTREFFREICATMPESVTLVLAARHGQYVAGALCLRGDNALFGRNWGCEGFYPGLHYEVCYYQTIEYCIEMGLERLEAGAQGEHKISRGFVPVETSSAHWIKHPAFRDAIGDFVRHEQRGIRHYMEEMKSHSPYKQGAPARGSVALAHDG